MPFELKPWRPFRELTTLRDEVDRIWDRFLGEWPRVEPTTREWTPSLDVSETKDNIVVKAEIPGVEPKDIDISLANDVLTIKGEKKQEREEKDENFYCCESSYGSFIRSMRLPHEVESDRIKADYKNGTLKITLPKSEKARKKEIKIEVK
jgi:HSP20 family protein